eukprot:TRINITY_DN105014_c0_g1_i1.p6 TRINITY_DN105014_c0_g1~~TRINITY_DN105014_c0_g1_i1.p6  ORF type:complete len:551 (-),score=82.26 TRINITY_DN105014_c0_g1_i1:14827-16479(-)
MKEIIADLPHTCGNANGLHVAKKLISLSTKGEYEKYQSEIVKMMMKNSIEMAQNPYGNYALQIVMDSYPIEKCAGVIESIKGKVGHLSITKYSSNVVERCMEKAGEKLRAELITELINADNFIGLMKNNFGNYVIQKALLLATPALKEELALKLQESVAFLSNKKLKANWSRVIEDLEKSGATSLTGQQRQSHICSISKVLFNTDPLYQLQGHLFNDYQGSAIHIIDQQMQQQYIQATHNVQYNNRINKMSTDKPAGESTLVGEVQQLFKAKCQTGLGFVKRDVGAKNEEDKGLIDFPVYKNDGTIPAMRALIDLKNIIAKQLPKMPKEYITRLIMDRNHEAMLIVKKATTPVKVIGGVVYRPFEKCKFVEIAFLAITSLEQVKGYGTRLMNKLKSHLQKRKFKYMLTYADNNAIGYFKKQGFSTIPRMPKHLWVGYIKDYDSGTLMDCYLNPDIDYNNISDDLKKQKAALLEAVKKCYHLKKYPGLEFGEDSHAAKKKKVETTGEPIYLKYEKQFNEIPGLAESGWDFESYKKSMYFYLVFAKLKQTGI